MTLAPALSSLYRSRARQWAQYYALLEQQLGATATIIPFGDQTRAGKVNASTFTGYGFNASGLSPTWTPGIALDTWATPFDLASEANWQGDAPILTFKGSGSEYISSPDAAYWTSALAAFSLSCWLNITTLSASAFVFDKHDEGAAKEFIFSVSDGKLQTVIYDNTAGSYIGRSYNTAIAVGAWRHVAVTYSGGATSAAIKIYLDGVQVDDTNVESGVFTTMRDTATTVILGCGQNNTAANYFYTGKLLGGPFGLAYCQAELTVAQVKNIYQGLRTGAGL